MELIKNNLGIIIGSGVLLFLLAAFATVVVGVLLFVPSSFWGKIFSRPASSSDPVAEAIDATKYLTGDEAREVMKTHAKPLEMKDRSIEILAAKVGYQNSAAKKEAT